MRWTRQSPRSSWLSHDLPSTIILPFFGISEMSLDGEVETGIFRFGPASSRGAFRDRHGRGRRDAVDMDGAADESALRGRRSRVVLPPRRWRQVCGVIRKRRWQESPVTGESAL